MRIFFFQNSCQKITNSYRRLLRSLHVQYGSLEHSLQSQCLSGNIFTFCHFSSFRKGLKMLIKKILQLLFQAVNIATTCGKHLLTRTFKKQCIEHMLSRQILMTPALGFPNGQGKRNLHILIKHFCHLCVLSCVNCLIQSYANISIQGADRREWCPLVKGSNTVLMCLRSSRRARR